MAGRHRPAEHIELHRIPADQQLHLVLLLPTYFYPYPWLSYELREIQELVREHSAPMMVGYCVGTSAAVLFAEQMGSAASFCRPVGIPSHRGVKLR